MRIQKRQCLLGILPGKLFLSIGQVSIYKSVMGVGRIGISQQVELEDLDRIFYVARALIILSDDVHGNFRPQLRPEDLCLVLRAVAASPVSLRRVSVAGSGWALLPAFRRERGPAF